MITQVVEMTLGCTTWRWLCADCQDRRRVDGWTLKVSKVVAFGCDDCSATPRAAAVDYVPTSPDARRPTPQECPPPRPIAPWGRPRPMDRQVSR